MLAPSFRYNAGLIRANGTPFFTGDGSTSSAQLVDRHGNPISSAKLKRVDAIHRTDWQGRQLLYTTPQTNKILQSQSLASSPWTGTASATVSSNTFAGTVPYYTVAKTTSNLSENHVQSGIALASVGDVVKLSFAIRAGTSITGEVGIYNAGGDSWGTNASSSAVIKSGPGTLTQAAGALFIVGGLSATQDTLVEITRTFAIAGSYRIYLYPGTTGSTIIGDSNLYTRFMLTQNQANQGAYIETTTAAVTVTDYTLTGSTVSFGETPIAGATCDWTGVARR